MKKTISIAIIALISITNPAFAAKEGTYISNPSNQTITCTQDGDDLSNTIIKQTRTLTYKPDVIDVDLGQLGNATIPLTNNHGGYKTSKSGGEGDYSGTVNATVEVFVKDDDTINLIGNTETTLNYSGKSQVISCNFQQKFIRS